MGRGSTFAMVLVAAVVWLLSMSLFVVNQQQVAIKFKWGEFQQATYKPGLHWKIPFMNTVRRFDGRILTLDADPERYLTFEKKNVIVDSFVKWRINDVALYYTTMGGDEQRADMRISQVVKDALRSEFGKRTIQEAISGERSNIMRIVAEKVESEVKNFGIKIVDVRIKRVELPADVSDSVYDRMRAERARVAKDLRSRGAEAAERIRADADRQRTILLAEADRDAQRLRGEGDAKAAEIYAQAYTRDPEFFDFYRSLQAYRNVFDKKQDMLVLDPKSEFFQYFQNDVGRSNTR